MTLKNTSGATLKIASIIQHGDFYQANNCPHTLLPNATCTLSVTFTPTVAGSRPGFLTISDNAPGSPQKLPLKGTASGTGSIKLTLSPASLSFGSVAVGTTSNPQTVTVTNVGSVAASFVAPFGFDTAGTDCADFHINSQCGNSLAPNASCEVTVTFKPKASGTRTGFFAVHQGARTVAIPMSGTATTDHNFVMPFNGTLYLQQKGGEAGASTEFGLGTSPNNFVKYYSGLPNNPDPVGEVLVGSFTKGTIINFGMFTEFGSATGWAFSSGTDRASVVAFSDVDDSLHMGGGIMQQTSSTTWLLHLDDALSYQFDDDDNDVLMQVRVVPQ